MIKKKKNSNFILLIKQFKLSVIHDWRRNHSNYFKNAKNETVEREKINKKKT